VETDLSNLSGSLYKRREGGKDGKVGKWAGFRVWVRISDTLTLKLTLALALTVTLILALTF